MDGGPTPAAAAPDGAPPAAGAPPPPAEGAAPGAPPTGAPAAGGAPATDAAPEGGAGAKAGNGTKGGATAAAASAIRGSIEAAVPCLLVDDMAASLGFWVGTLGFHLTMGVDGAHGMVGADGGTAVWPTITFAMLSGDGRREGPAEVMLEKRSHCNPVAAAHGDRPMGGSFSLYLRGPDPDAAARSLPPSVKVLVPPSTQWYGMREVTVVDPVNGYIVTLGKATGEFDCSAA